jgi:hypothetical protein
MEVFVSTDNGLINENTIARALSLENIDASVTPNASSHAGTMEHGFAIKFHKLTGEEFRDRAWYPILQPMMGLECAFVKVEGGYHGCVLEWPDVFREPVCPTVLRRNAKKKESGRLRVAYCIAGQPRYYDGYGYKSVLDKLLTKYDVDVFFHCWWDESEVGKLQHRSSWSGGENVPISGSCKEDLLCQYRPKKHEFEPSRFFYEQGEALMIPDKDSWSRASYPYMYSQQRVATMKREYEKEMGFTYDLAIMSRFDIGLGVLQDLHTIDPSAFTVPSITRLPGMCCDAFTLTSSSNFDKVYLDMFDNAKGFLNDEGVATGNEAVLYHQAIVRCGLPLVRMRKTFLQILRGPEKPEWVVREMWLQCPDEFDP